MVGGGLKQAGTKLRETEARFVVANADGQLVDAVTRKRADFGLVFNHNNECGVKQKM